MRPLPIVAVMLLGLAACRSEEDAEVLGADRSVWQSAAEPDLGPMTLPPPVMTAFAVPERAAPTSESPPPESPR